MAHPLKRVIETRILTDSLITGLNEKLSKLQAENKNIGGGVWEPHGKLIVDTTSMMPTYIIVMNRYDVKTF